MLNQTAFTINDDNNHYEMYHADTEDLQIPYKTVTISKLEFQAAFNEARVFFANLL